MRPATGFATARLARRALVLLLVVGLAGVAARTFLTLGDIDPRGRASWNGTPVVVDHVARPLTVFVPACDVRAIVLHPTSDTNGWLVAHITRQAWGPRGQAWSTSAGGATMRLRGSTPVPLPMDSVAHGWREAITLHVQVADNVGQAAPGLPHVALDAARPVSLDVFEDRRLGRFACAFDGGRRDHAWTVVAATLVGLGLAGLLAAWWLARSLLLPDGTRMSSRVAACLAVVLTAVTTIVYGLVVPPFEAPDELAHLQYARYVATTGTLPRGVPTPDSEWRASSYEWVQQPLYYIGAAAILRAAGLHAPGPVLAMNPRSRLQPAGTEPTIFQHGQPPVPATGHRALLLLRGVSLAMAMATTWLVARLVAMVSRDPLIIATVAGGLGLIPQWCAVMGAVSTDPPATLLAAAATLAIVHVGLGRRSTRWLLLTGVLVGAAYGVKATAVFLVPMTVLACVAAAWRAPRLTSSGPAAPPETGRMAQLAAGAARRLSVLAVGVIVVAGWIPLRAWIVFGDPQASAFRRAVLEAGGFVPTTGPMPWTAEFWRQMRVMVFEPFWARFGSLGAGPFTGSRVWVVYGVTSALLLACAIGGTVTALRIVRRWRDPADHTGAPHQSAVPVLLCATGVTLGLTAWAVVNLVPQADMVVHWTPRHVLPLTAPAAVLVAAGLERLRQTSLRTRRAGEAVVGVMVAALALSHLGVLRATLLMLHFGY